jgi:periplasmic divalent cation tolerance protein
MAMSREQPVHGVRDSMIAVHTTIDDAEGARRIARTLVERKLAACVQISTVESFYAWNGAVAHEPEFRILIKTRADLYAAVESAIRQLHSYDLPAIYAVAVHDADPAYAQWVQASTAEHP